jgi:hypothetical protein
MFNEDEQSLQEASNTSPENFGSISELLASEAKERARLASKPNIDHLPDAVVNDELGRQILLARPGEKIVIERFATILPHRPWLDTKSYTVQSIDEATGRVHLWDDELQRMAMTDYTQAVKVGHRIKLPTARTVITSKRKRGRPRKDKGVETPVVDASSPPKKRGRPKGVKNRDKETIAAEKTAIKAAKKSASNR